jgi:hypothetical protein
MARILLVPVPVHLLIILGGGTMARERLRKRREAALEAEDQLVAEAAEAGALESFHGQPLDLSDDSPTWFMNRLLRREGVSHPLIERGRDIDEAARELWQILEPVRRRRETLSQARIEPSEREVATFNGRREQVLAEVRERLPALNRLIRDHNLMVPDALHRRTVPVEETMTRLEAELPALEHRPPEDSTRPARRTGRLRRLIGRRGD